jgi:pimeloyl-ACP methyl ester carboxylesterase
MTEAPTITTGVLRVPDAHLYYEVRGSGPLLLVVGAPMDASFFVPLADRLAADFTVLTTDPRGINRSPLDDPDTDSTPQQRGDDLAALVAHVGGGPAIAFGSSGGAASVLALAERHPEAVRTVVPHEPPLDGMIPGHVSRSEEMVALYRSGDRVGAMRVFMANAGFELPEEVFQQMFGTTPEGQALADEQYMFNHMLVTTTTYEPDVAALRDGPVRIVLGVGAESAGQYCDRSTRGLAERLGIGVEVFPGDHGGFVGDPDAFAARLREVLA